MREAPPPAGDGRPPQLPAQGLVLHAVRAMHGDLSKIGGKVSSLLDLAKKGAHHAPRWQLVLCAAVAFTLGMVLQALVQIATRPTQ